MCSRLKVWNTLILITATIWLCPLLWVTTLSLKHENGKYTTFLVIILFYSFSCFKSVVITLLLSLGYLVNSYYIPDEILGKIVPPALFVGTAYGAYGIGAMIGSRLNSSPSRFKIRPYKIKPMRSRLGSLFGGTGSGFGSRFKLG